MIFGHIGWCASDPAQQGWSIIKDCFGPKRNRHFLLEVPARDQLPPFQRLSKVTKSRRTFWWAVSAYFKETPGVCCYEYFWRGLINKPVACAFFKPYLFAFWSTMTFPICQLSLQWFICWTANLDFSCFRSFLLVLTRQIVFGKIMQRVIVWIYLSRQLNNYGGSVCGFVL